MVLQTYRIRWHLLSTSDSTFVSAPVLLLAAGVVIFFGVIGESFFKKTGIPDVAFIMMLGVLIGPVLGIIQPEVVLEVVPYFAALALIIIMFDGGLNLEIKSMVKTAHFALILSIIGFVISVGIVTGLTHYWLEWGWIESILLGSIVGGSSSAIVFGLVRNLHISGGAKSMLSFESALTDILATIVAFVLFEAVLTGNLDINTLGRYHWQGNCSGTVSRICSRNSMDVSYDKAVKQPARIHADPGSPVCPLLFGKRIWRVRCADSLGVWPDAWKQGTSFKISEIQVAKG